MISITSVAAVARGWRAAGEPMPVGLARTERVVRERMTLFDVNIETMTPQALVNPKALSAVVRDFFGRSQLTSLWIRRIRSAN